MLEPPPVIPKEPSRETPVILRVPLVGQHERQKYDEIEPKIEEIQAIARMAFQGDLINKEPIEVDGTSNKMRELANPTYYTVIDNRYRVSNTGRLMEIIGKISVGICTEGDKGKIVKEEKKKSLSIKKEIPLKSTGNGGIPVIDFLPYKGGHSSNIRKLYLNILCKEKSNHPRWKYWQTNPVEEKLLDKDESLQHWNFGKN